MWLRVQCVLVVLGAAWCIAKESKVPEPGSHLRVQTESGCVYGGEDPEKKFGYFLAVPYAKQPLNELRFQELKRAEPWTECRCATKVGPACPQRDLFYGSLMVSNEQSEACIHANIYVPLDHLKDLQEGTQMLPVLVYIHGGGFAFGSGNPDLHGPEYLMKEDIIVITFNYRIGPFGFLSLNSTGIPGNAGLRDIVTLLRWVKRNVEAFGGDPSEITLAGQSAGAAAAHILSLSKPAQGLFHKVILMSGAASRGFFTTSPAYARTMADMYLRFLSIDSTNPEKAHRILIDMPLERIMMAHNQLQDVTGLLTFTPVVESEFKEWERILDDEPEVLQAKGRGKDIPFLIGFTNKECETFRPRFKAINIVKRVREQPVLVVPPEVIYDTPPAKLPNKIMDIQNEYFNPRVKIGRFVRLSSDSYFVYPALKLAKARAGNGGAPVYLYRFAYNAEYSVFKEMNNQRYRGAGHSEDLTFVFRPNNALRGMMLPAADLDMISNMTLYFANFARESKPSAPTDWEQVTAERGVAQYKNIVNYEETDTWLRYWTMMQFFDRIYDQSS